MSEWFVDQWPYYVAVLVATVLTVLVLRVTFLRLRELHLEIERLQLKNEQLSRKLEEEGVTVFRPALQVTRFGLLGNLLPALTLAVLVLVVVYSGIQGTSTRVKHSMQMDQKLRLQENAFRKEIEPFKKSVERTEAAFGDEMMTFRIELATGGQPESPESDEATRSRDVQIIEKRVIEIISEQMGADPVEITRETSFIKDLNADELDTVELVMEFEDEFNMSIPDEEAVKIQTVGAAIDYIAAYSELEGTVRFIFTLPTFKSPGK